jgi:hypothetical protein
MRDLSEEYRVLINNFVFRESVAIKVNNEGGRYLETKKG